MAVQICNKCGEDNKENAMICSSCSNPLAGSKVIGTPDKEKDDLLFRKNDMKFCSHCGEKTEEGSMRCKRCGTLTVKTPSSGGYYAPYPSSVSGSSGPSGCAMALLIGGTIIIPLVGLIVGGIYAFDDDTDKRDAGMILLGIGAFMIVLWIFLGLIT